ncbi:MAG: pantetheine-phosphate adenylyltransferase [Dorea sp.]|nr:pantetheine-phosphate adenylyltransferase [Dorea sp.]
MIAIYPGSFDPATYGHIDIIKRASKLADKLIVGVLNNIKKTPLFSVEERVRILKNITKDMPNVEVVTFEGLLIDFAAECHADMIIRGLRAVTDFEYELQLAQTNHKLSKDIETVFLITNLEYSYLSSSIVKEVASFGGDISAFVTPEVRELIEEKMINRQ